MSFVSKVPQAVIDGLQRSFERQIDILPTEYLRQFFRIKIGDDIRALETAPPKRGLQQTKLKRVKQTLRMLENANGACAVNYNRMLETAYGRKGKMKWELLTPLMHDPAAPLPERIIPAVEKSRPPTYTPELAALHTSSLSRTSKALTSKALQVPPTLPERADPNSKLARLLGPFSKRREVNIHKRFYKEELLKILPPLEVVALEQNDSQESSAHPIRGTGLEFTNVFEDIEAISGSPWVVPTTPLRGREAGNVSPPSVPDEANLGIRTNLRQRFVRRRFQHLLSQIPILSQKPSKTQSNSSDKVPIRYVVTRSPRAMLNDRRNNPQRYPLASAADMAWFELAESESQKKKTKGGKKSVQNIDKQESKG
ncbi:hypothetical protein QCA50_016352 [Cerrena zonata]|uniref:LYR motif-containing protein Cup1-like N-terminal domain-containing protein n=1 Tax=Cerrena zonata TaxID=2478898 RepID=A0AAW0FNH7_9APHY